MAANHVPSDQTPLQGQDIYTNSYQHLFNSADRYGTPSWDSQLNQQVGLATNNNATGQHWHNGAFTQQSFPPHGQTYATHNPSVRTPSPYQYGHFGQQGSIGSYGQPSNVDPSLGLDPNTIRQQQQSAYPMPMRHSTPQGQPGTITPQALQHNVASVQQHRPATSPYQIPKSTTEIFSQQRSIPPNSFVKPVQVPVYEIPKGRKSGGLYVVDQAALAKATKSVALNKFVTLGSESFHLATNRTALPVYTARQSIKDLKKAGADSKKLRAKLALAKSHSKVLKSVKRPIESLAGLRREASDSGSSSESSEDDSDYTDDEEEEEMPISASRPDDPHEAVRYDVIKATWFPSSSTPSSDKIKNSMREIWEVLSTIQKRWRIDSKAVSDAEDQKKVGELPVLKSRVTSQRDLLHSALKAMLEYSHPDVVYQMGLIKPFLYLCYQFLANRFHSKDYDGPLAAAIFEVLSRCGTLTSELLEETKVIKALTSMKKHANEKHKAFIQQIVDSAVANTKKAKASSPPSAGQTENKGAKRPATELGTRSGSEGPAVKKAKSVEPLSNGTKKETGTAPSKASATSSTNLKKVGEKPPATPVPIKTRVNQVNNKPSSIFASLTAAAKKPVVPPSAPANKANVSSKPASTVVAKDKKLTTPAATKPAFSFAQTMASLIKPKEQEVTPVKTEKQYPAETSEEKAKRLRKESRRHLRVTFRPDASLVDIKYFTHVPEEEEGHDENFVRDAGDIGGEGRMFKQHKELDEDEDEDPEEVEYRSWSVPSQIDFSKMPSEADGNFAPYGGGTKKPSSPEKDADVQRENLTLMVFYSNASDIPPSPREPPEIAQEAATPATVVNFGTPPESVLKKCPQPAQPVAVPDYSRLEGLIASLSNAAPTASQTPFSAPPAPVQEAFVPPLPTGPAPDLAALLASLGQAPPPPMPVQAPQQAVPAPFDYASLVATMQAQAANGMSLPPPPPGPMPFAFPFGVQPPIPDAAAFQPPMQPQYGQQDQYGPQDQYNQQANGGNKRSRDDGNNNANSAQGKRHKGRGERPHKVLACKFFHKGTCNKGDNCTYIHDLNM